MDLAAAVVNVNVFLDDERKEDEDETNASVVGVVDAATARTNVTACGAILMATSISQH